MQPDIDRIFSVISVCVAVITDSSSLCWKSNHT